MRWKILPAEVNRHAIQFDQRRNFMSTQLRISKLGVKHLRSFSPNEAELSVSPITILVGANSAGKSSLLRVFPLFSQTIDARRNGPVLWFGKLVDFETCAAARTDNVEDPVEFSFTMKGLKIQEMEMEESEVRLFVKPKTEKENDNHASYLSRMEFVIYGKRVQINADENELVRSITVADTPYTPSTRLFVAYPSGTVAQISGFGFGAMSVCKPILVDYLCNAGVHGGSAAAFARNTRHSLSVESIKSTISKHLLKRSAGREPLPEWWDKLQTHAIANSAPRIANELLWLLGRTLAISGYMSPLRATAERHYRYQDLSMSQVDPKGENLAAFLSGLSPARKAKFSAWCHRLLGFVPKVKMDGSHLSIQIQSGNEPARNHVDLGFGYSQLLPLAAAIWATASTRTIPQTSRILAIEQPELHLHPRLQSRFADLLVETVREFPGNIQIICETHSETIINRLGELIHKKKVKPTDISVSIVDKEEGKGSAVRTATFTEKGSLQNWPYGFFLWEDPDAH